MNNSALDEFFVYDIYNIDQVKSKLYGYIINENGIFTNETMKIGDIPPDTSMDGSYIFIISNDNEVIINQDYWGSWGLYYYVNGDYWAISNSFKLLAEFLSDKQPLTLNKIYLDSFLNVDLSSYSVYDTPINEITLLDRWASIHFNKDTNKLNIEIKNNPESTIPIDSLEGISILDKWYQKWHNIITSMISKTADISADLSGGFDTRMMFSLFLSPQINLKKVHINSINADYHCFNEDYCIASEIATKYNFSLNNMAINDEGPYFSVKSIDRLYNLIKLGFHKIPFIPEKCFSSHKYLFTGEGGEGIRGYWKNNSYEKFLTTQLEQYRELNIPSKSELYPNILKFIKKQYQDLKNKYKLLNHKITESELTHILYKESRTRHHYGKTRVERYFANQITLSPLMDPLINMLISNIGEMPAVIYDRYCPDLLNIRIEGGRIIDENAISFAHELNKKYPVSINHDAPQNFELPITLFDCPNKSDEDIDYMKYLTNLVITKETRDTYCKDFCAETYYSLINSLLTPNMKFPIQYATSIYTISIINKLAKSINSSQLDLELIKINTLYSLYCQERYYDIIRQDMGAKNETNIFIKIIIALAYSKIDIKQYSGKIYDYLMSAYSGKVVESLYKLFDILYLQTDIYSLIQLKLVCDKLSSIDNFDANVRIARSYHYGKGKNKNLQKSIEYYEKTLRLHPEWVISEYIQVLYEEHSAESLQKIVALEGKYVPITNNQIVINAKNDLKAS